MKVACANWTISSPKSKPASDQSPMKILVTAGPTHEPIDPVRYIGNRSSGKMGFAVVEAAREAGHEVRLIAGPVSIPYPPSIPVTSIETAEEMYEAVCEQLDWCDVLVMVAAVADWRPAVRQSQKMKKTDGPAVIQLERTKDILASIKERKAGRLFIGFAAETEDMLRNASSKCVDKGLDMIVANDVSAPDAGFEVDTNRVSFVYPDGSIQKQNLMSKLDTARRIVSEICTLAKASKEI